MKPRFTVVKGGTRNYGYSIRDASPSPAKIKGTWLVDDKPPSRVFGWYKYKRDAQHRADVLNEEVA